MRQLSNKRIVLGITGGIAAYKSAEVVRRLKDAGSDVRVVMTQSAQAFITPLTFQALSGNPVHTDLLDSEAEAAMGHIELARWADAVVIAPCSAEFMSNLAHGHAHDLLATLCLATEATLAIAPAMNYQMWMDAATQANLDIIKNRGIHIFGPDSGSQACGEFGPGRMLEPALIVDEVANGFMSLALDGVQLVVTAGPTHESIDPVRFIANHSSGKMGYALAEAAVAAGAGVTLISGPTHLTPPDRVELMMVTTAQEMYERVMAQVAETDVFIANAAVGDYRCKKISPVKLAKNGEAMHLTLIQNPDIVLDVGQMKPRPFVVGFAAETDQVIEKAQVKRKAKGMDIIAANQVGLADRGFGSDNNAFTAIWAEGQQDFPLGSKAQLARNFINLIAERFALYEKDSIKDTR